MRRRYLRACVNSVWIPTHGGDATLAFFFWITRTVIEMLGRDLGHGDGLIRDAYDFEGGFPSIPYTISFHLE